MQNRIIELASRAKPEHLMLSRFNCHIKGLHSIVLDKNEHTGQLTRCFLADSNHEMHSNINITTGKISLGVHSHRYDIKITGVSGEAINIVMRESHAGFLYKEFDFYSREKINNLGFMPLELESIEPILDGVEIFMPHNFLHTVYVPIGAKAAWIVEEGVIVSGKTSLFTNKDPECSAYQSPKDPLDVISFLHGFF